MTCVDHGKVGDAFGYYHCSYLGKQTSGHRREYLRENGMTHEDAKGLVVRHTCDNPRCVNLEHLVLGTHKDNMQDMVDRRRAARGERHSKTTLTARQVEEIRNALGTQTALAKAYGVSQGTISNIKRNVTWSL